MKVRLPKHSKGYGLDELAQFEMNNFDVEEVLPPLFYLIVTGGRRRGSCPNDPKNIEAFVDRLATHERMSGFDSAKGREVLDRWVRATLIKTSRLGKARVGDQIAYIVPLTLLSYKAGFPIQISRLRKVHTFLYAALRSAFASVDAKPSRERLLQQVFREAFGQGVEPGAAPYYDSSYDGRTRLDISTLMALTFLDGFAPTPIAVHRKTPLEETVDRGPALPQTLSTIGQALLAYVTAYANVLPVVAVTRGLAALINFFLFTYSLKLVYAANELRSSKMLPSAMSGGASTMPEVYTDFTRVRGSDSDSLARWCVNRDIEEFAAYFGTAVTLRTIARFSKSYPKLAARLDVIGDAPGYLLELAKMESDPSIEARAIAEYDLIYEETRGSMSEDELGDLESWIADITQNANGPLDRTVQLLVAAQGTDGVEAYMKWFSNVGGIKKGYGLLSGSRRNVARYAMSDDLLAALVQVAMTELHEEGVQASIRPRLQLQSFISYLRDTFGILVDRPPQLMDSALTRAAAAENLEAFKRRLRQMGYFQALSDDFTAQYLRSDLGGISA